MLPIRTRLYATGGLAVLGFIATMAIQPALAQQQPSFFDGFDSINAARWYISDGWSNGPHQNCGWSKKEISVANGSLNVGFSKNPAADNRIYRCGEIQSNAVFSYGTFEARLKTPAGSGLNAAFFTYIGPPNGKVHDEMDFEVLLKDTAHVQTGGFVADKGVPPSTPALPNKSDADFVDYAFVWAPDSLKYYINGKLVQTLDAAATPIQSHSQKIFFSLWGTDTLTDWMGPFVDPGKPIAMQVDWVAYTAPGDKCLFPESITCQGG